MSRIGKVPILVPSGVTVTTADGLVSVVGPKGTLSQALLPSINITQDGDQLLVSRLNDERQNRSKHGLMRTLVSNMIVGVTTGFSKQLEVNGVGYRVAMTGNALKLNVGYSHDIMYKVPEEIKITVDQNIITVTGISKQQVGQTAAEIREFRKPEPYKGKGIKYVGEHIIRKSGKSGKETTT
jgi:large subunit ribosomal protein L6